MKSKKSLSQSKTPVDGTADQLNAREYIKAQMENTDKYNQYMDQNTDINLSETGTVKLSELKVQTNFGVLDKVRELEHKKDEQLYNDYVGQSPFYRKPDQVTPIHGLIVPYNYCRVTEVIWKTIVKDYYGYFKFMQSLFWGPSSTPLNEILEAANVTEPKEIAYIFTQFLAFSFEPLKKFRTVVSFGEDIHSLGGSRPTQDVYDWQIEYRYESTTARDKRVPKGNRLSPPQKAKIYEFFLYWVRNKLLSLILFLRDESPKQVYQYAKAIKLAWNMENIYKPKVPATVSKAATGELIPSQQRGITKLPPFTHLPNDVIRDTDRYGKAANLWETRHKGHRFADGTVVSYLGPNKEPVTITNIEKNAAKVINSIYAKLIKENPGQTRFTLTAGQIYKAIYGRETHSHDLIENMAIMLTKLRYIDTVIVLSDKAIRQVPKDNKEKLQTMTGGGNTITLARYLAIDITRDKITRDLANIDIYGVGAAYQMAQLNNRLQLNQLKETETTHGASEQYTNVVQDIQDFLNQSLHEYLLFGTGGYTTLYKYDKAYKNIYDYGDGTPVKDITNSQRHHARELIKERFKEIMGQTYSRSYTPKTKTGKGHSKPKTAILKVIVPTDQDGNIVEYEKNKSIQISVEKIPLLPSKDQK